MRKLHVFMSLIFGLILFACPTPGAENNPDPEGPPQYGGGTYDFESLGIPRFVEELHTNYDNVERITFFRSSAGHDYSDAFESCRSMKHYYFFTEFTDWTEYEMYSPVDGQIIQIVDEGGYGSGGFQVWVESSEYPGIVFAIFHMDVDPELSLGDLVVAGQSLGNHSETGTWNDLSTMIFAPHPTDPNERILKLVSFYEVLTDEAFAELSPYGITTREDLAISQALRDANPLVCSDDPQDLSFNYLPDNPDSTDPLFVGDDSHAWFFLTN